MLRCSTTLTRTTKRRQSGSDKTKVAADVETVGNISMIVFMQAGSTMALENNEWLPPRTSLKPVPGRLWVSGGFQRKLVQWMYKPKQGPLYNSLTLGYQLNDHSFCQWFALIAFFADHGDINALHTLRSFTPEDYYNNYLKVIKFVEFSSLKQVSDIRRDICYLYNMKSFYNHGQTQHYQSENSIKNFYLRSGRPCKTSRELISELCFFDNVRLGLQEYFESRQALVLDSLRSYSRSRSRRSRSR